MWWGWAYIPVLVILIVEAFFAMELLSWRGSLNHYQRRVDDGMRSCKACLTNADVILFNSKTGMCNFHQAHWELTHDLEQRTSGGSTNADAS